MTFAKGLEAMTHAWLLLPTSFNALILIHQLLHNPRYEHFALKVISLFFL